MPGVLWHEKSERQEFGQILGNMSSVELALKNYHECANTIELMLRVASRSISEDKVEKFKKRLKICLKHTKIPRRKVLCTPVYTPNKFEIVYDEKVGRHGSVHPNLNRQPQGNNYVNPIMRKPN